MANSITYVEQMQTYSASVMSSDGIDTGTREVQMGQQKQKDLNEVIKQKKAELDDLKAQMEEVEGKSGFEKTMGGMFGNDCGASDLKAKTESASAEMKKTMDQLKSTEAEIDMLMQEIQGSQKDMADATSDNQKTRDESDKATSESAGG